MKAAFINWNPASITAIQLAIDKENDDFFDANEVFLRRQETPSHVRSHTLLSLYGPYFTFSFHTSR